MNEKNKTIYHISQRIVFLKGDTRNLCTGPEGRGPTLNQCITGIKLHRKSFFNTKGSERAVKRE
jgi:hypothetical protein